jgi:phosphodiesterase/alkaline phosphatase D-like protein
MLILGNLYNHKNSLWIIVLSSFELDDYKYFKKSQIIDGVIIYQYNIEISDNSNIKLGSYKTICIPNVKPMLNNTSVYFVSCDGQNIKLYNSSNPIDVYNVSDDTDMWKKLYMDIKADTNIHKYVIHLGDQVYMDGAHDELIKNNMTNDDDIIQKTYYEVYKLNYSNKYKKNVLESAYNIMIGDDHETIDNYGSVPNILTQTMLKNAKYMYKIFQEDLYGIKQHNIKHLLFNDFQIIIPDLRKYRKTITDNITKYPIMGQIQINELYDIIKNTQTKIKRTYYVNTIPFIGINKTSDIFWRIITRYTDLNSDNYFSSDGYSNERIHIMNELFKLNGDVIVVCGDYHYAEYHTFIKNDKIIKQITTSPISSDPIPLRAPLYKQILMWILTYLLYDRIIDKIKITKKWSVYDYNYLKITNNNAMLNCYNDYYSKSIDM